MTRTLVRRMIFIHSLGVAGGSRIQNQDLLGSLFSILHSLKPHSPLERQELLRSPSAQILPDDAQQHSYHKSFSRASLLSPKGAPAQAFLEPSNKNLIQSRFPPLSKLLLAVSSVTIFTSLTKPRISRDRSGLVYTSALTDPRPNVCICGAILELEASKMDSAGKQESLGCSRCGKAAKMICAGCKGLPDGLQRQMEVHYCGAECQRKDWASHKTSCSAARARKVIYRAAESAKAISQLFLRIKYKMIIDEVKRFGNVWMICPPSEYKGGKCVLHPFPSTLFPNKEDADAILEFQSCNAVLDHLHEFLKQLLIG